MFLSELNRLFGGNGCRLLAAAPLVSVRRNPEPYPGGFDVYEQGLYVFFSPSGIGHRSRTGMPGVEVVAHEDNLVEIRGNKLQVVKPVPFFRKSYRRKQGHGDLSLKPACSDPGQE